MVGLPYKSFGLPYNVVNILTIANLLYLLHLGLRRERRVCYTSKGPIRLMMIESLALTLCRPSWHEYCYAVPASVSIIGGISSSSPSDSVGNIFRANVRFAERECRQTAEGIDVSRARQELPKADDNGSGKYCRNLVENGKRQKRARVSPMLSIGCKHGTKIGNPKRLGT